MVQALHSSSCCGEHSVTGGLRINRILKADPTRTTTIRKAYVAAVTKRFRKVQRDIRETLVTNDALGLEQPQRPLGLAAAPSKAFAFRTDPKKIEAFMDWLKTEIDAEILEIDTVTSTAPGVPWQHTYIDSAYKKGLRRGRAELKKAGIEISRFPDEPFFGGIESLFNTPVHATRVAMLYLRNFEELKGITSAMSQQISRIMAEGMAEGRGPRWMASRIAGKNGVVENIGLRRARVMARTEVVRAHHVATIETYRAARVERVKIKAEWLTAGDDRVCADCGTMEGAILTLEQVENLIPLHPQCRCIALPFLVGITEPLGDDLERRIGSIGSRAKTKTGIARRRGFFEQKTGRKLRGVPAAGKPIQTTPPPESEMERRRKEAAKARKRAKARAKLEET